MFVMRGWRKSVANSIIPFPQVVIRYANFESGASLFCSRVWGRFWAWPHSHPLACSPRWDKAGGDDGDARHAPGYGDRRAMGCSATGHTANSLQPAWDGLLRAWSVI